MLQELVIKKKPGLLRRIEQSRMLQELTIRKKPGGCGAWRSEGPQSSIATGSASVRRDGKSGRGRRNRRGFRDMKFGGSEEDKI